MGDKLKQFTDKIHNTTNVLLVDSLIEHAQKITDDTDYYEAVKIAKAELLNRLQHKS